MTKNIENGRKKPIQILNTSGAFCGKDGPLKNMERIWMMGQNGDKNFSEREV